MMYMFRFNLLLVSCLMGFTDLSGQWSTNGSSVVHTADNVGIKTIAPSTDLEVRGRGIIRATSTTPSFQLYQDELNGEFFESSDDVFLNSQRGDLRFGTALSGTAASSMTISGDSGNVGIGLTVPTQSLDVNGAIRLVSTSLAADADGSIRYVIGRFQGYSSGSWKYLDEAGLWDQTGTAAHYTSGSIGIGTNDPKTDLDVHGDGHIRAPRFQLFDFSEEGNRIAGDLYGEHNNIFLRSTRGDLRFASGHPGSATTRMTINGTDGYVGIGTNHPAHLLHVNGNMAVAGYVLGPSDERLKEYGFIAQELENLLPALVVDKTITGVDGTEYKGINHQQLIPILTQAIKELSKEYDPLSEQIREHQKKLEKYEKMEKRVAKLEAILIHTKR